MRIAEINSCNFGSTGNIMLGIAETARENGMQAVCCVPKSRDNLKKAVKEQILIGSRLSRNIHLKMAELTGLNGCFQKAATRSFLRQLKAYNPDVIHMHNLHNCYINLDLLFRFIKENDIKAVWTLHDCWSFTGQCAHFTLNGCNRWKTGCGECTQFGRYPAARVDKTAKMFKLKKQWFCGVKDMTIVTPSEWLADLAKQSFLKEYPIKVINNGIDLEIFKPTDSDFRKQHGIANDIFLLLGVAFGWEKRKGLDAFLELYEKLPEDKFKIVLVGTDEEVDKKLPNGIVSIHRTQNQTELAKIYTAADLFVNPTLEENYPTVNMESIACGTPVLTFNTGGSGEMLNTKTGRVVPYGDTKAMIDEILRIEKEKPFSAADCLEHAESFCKAERFKEYIELFGEKE